MAIAQQVAEEHYDANTPTPKPAKPKKPRRKVVIPDTEAAERAAITPSHEDDIILFVDIKRAVGEMTPRQKEIYAMTMDGATREEIGAVLDVCPRRVGQLQAEIYAQIERELTVRLPSLVLPPLPLPDDGRQHKHVVGPDMLQVGVGDLVMPGIKRLMLVDLLLAHHRREAREPLIQTAASLANIKLDDSAWSEVGKVLASDSQLDWVSQVQGMREHPERMGGLLLLLRTRRVVALLRELVARGSKDNNSPNQVPMR